MTHFEKAEIADFIEIAALDRRAWQANRNSEFIPDGEHAWRLWVEHGLVYTAREDSRLVAAILAFPCASGVWCVHKLFVEYDRRGCGIGTKLFEVLLAETDTMGVDCFLTVDPANDNAVKLYEKWGFTERKFVAGYYQPSEDRFVLTRRART